MASVSALSKHSQRRLLSAITLSDFMKFQLIVLWPYSSAMYIAIGEIGTLILFKFQNNILNRYTFQ